MVLLLVYVGLTIAGTFAIYLFVGQVVERMLPLASMPVFLTLFFLMLWVAWIIAVKVTAPRDEKPAST